MKLTKLQRYTAYCILLMEAELAADVKQKTGYGPIYYLGGRMIGLCDLLANILERDDILLEIHDYFNLTELNKFKPAEGVYWFNNWEERITALKQCITELEAELWPANPRHKQIKK